MWRLLLSQDRVSVNRSESDWTKLGRSSRQAGSISGGDPITSSNVAPAPGAAASFVGRSLRPVARVTPILSATVFVGNRLLTYASRRMPRRARGYRAD
jgi:hypothetical protein